MMGAIPGSRADASSPQAVSTKGFDPERGEILCGEKNLAGVSLRWVAKFVPVKVCEGGGWYSKHPTERVLAFNYHAAHKRTWEQLERGLPDCATCGPSSIQAALECAEADLRKRFYSAIAMEARQGRDAEQLDGEAATAGAEGIAPDAPDIHP